MLTWFKNNVPSRSRSFLGILFHTYPLNKSLTRKTSQSFRFSVSLIASFPYLSSNVNPVNSTYHLSNVSTQHPQYPNQPLNSPPFFTVDQFPLTRKIKNPGTGTCPLTSPDSRKSLVFYTFSLPYSLTFDINTTHSTCGDSFFLYYIA